MTTRAGQPSDVREVALSAVWQAQAFDGPLRTRDGRDVQVISRGTWTHGFGPDFRDAMIALDGRELRSGSIEIHLETRGWRDHGHATDPRYNDVILHVVLDDDGGGETRREDGVVVPVVAIGTLLRELLTSDGVSTVDWSRFGGDACAPDLVRTQPTLVRQILARLGDARMTGRAARLEGRLTAETPAQVLYATILDGLGYHQNREPMAQVADILPFADLEAAPLTRPDSARLTIARGLLLGVGGFLPLSPTDAMLARLSPEAVAAAEAAWQSAGAAWHARALPPTAWVRARVRPNNHPALRLVHAAALIANSLRDGGIVPAVLEPLRTRAATTADQPGRVPDMVEHLRRLSASADAPGMGADRASAILASGVLPFALALAEHTGDHALTDGAAAVWERLSGPATNDITRRALRQVAGDARLTNLGARGLQGLIHLDQTLCAPRRCRECPIAHAAAADEAVSAG